MSLIENFAHKMAYIEIPTGVISDGVQMMTRRECMILARHDSGSKSDGNGSVAESGHVYIAPFGLRPTLPCNIIIDGETLPVSSIKEYRDLHGVLHGYRMGVAK